MDYSRQIATAKKLIAKYGQSVTWRQPKAIISDTSKPWLVAADDPVDNTVSMAFIPVTRVGYETLHFSNKTDVQSASVKGLMGPVSFTPSMQDVVIRGGVELRILSIDVLNVNGQIILYTIEFE